MTEIQTRRNSGLIAQDRALCWGEAMTTVLCLFLTIAMLFAAAIAPGQQPNKGAQMGYLSSGYGATESTRMDATRLALRELGYIEGYNIVIEHRYAEGKQDRQTALAAELVRLKVDVMLVSGGEPPIRAAMNATRTIPIVMTGQGRDPVKAGLVASLARPGGNVTGLTNFSRELGGKRLELLKETVPKVAHVVVLYDPVIPGTAREVKEDLPRVARVLGLTIQPWEVRSADGVERVFSALNEQRPSALYVPGGGAARIANNRIADFALN